MKLRYFHLPRNKFLNGVSVILEKFLSDLFEINQKTARLRLAYLLIFLFFLWIILALFAQPISDLQGEYFFYGLLPVAHDPIFYFFDQIISALFSINILRYFLVIISAIWFSSYVVSRFMNQIHNLKNIKPTMSFLQGTAFNLSNQDTLKIESGQVSSQAAKSALYKIGGPGKVMIGLENAAAFDRIDGSVEIIGPTVDMPNSVYFLSGFEKMREVIDLRDQAIKFNVSTRSKDGIPIHIDEIRLMFSIQRGTLKVTLTRPYSFSSQAAWWLIYQIPGQPWEKIEGIIRQLIIDKIRNCEIAVIPIPQANQELNHEENVERFLLKKKILNKQWLRKHGHPKFLFSHYHKNKTIIKTRIKRGSFKKIHPPIYFGTRQKSKPISQQTGISRMSIQTFFQEINQSFSDQIHQRGVKLEWMDFGIWSSPIFELSKQSQNYEDFLGKDQPMLNSSSLNTISQESRQEELARLFRIITTENNNNTFFTNNSESRMLLINLVELLKNYKRFTIGKSSEIIRKLEMTISLINKSLI